MLYETSTPQSNKTFRSFIVLHNFYNRFVSNAARITWLLTAMFHRPQVEYLLQLIEAELTAFWSWQDNRITRPILAFPRMKEHCTINTGASARQIRCLLLKKQDDVYQQASRVWVQSTVLPWKELECHPPRMFRCRLENLSLTVVAKLFTIDILKEALYSQMYLKRNGGHLKAHIRAISSHELKHRYCTSSCRQTTGIWRLTTTAHGKDV